MSWRSTLELNSLEELLRTHLEDLYDAELQFIDILPAMINAAHSEDLKQVLTQHFDETREHVTRVEDIFQQQDQTPSRRTSESMKGMIAECHAILSAAGDETVRDAAIIAAIQRVEHYEMASYGAARTWAIQLGRTVVAQILQQTLDEEGQADKILTEIAEQTVNAHAARC